MTFKEFYKLDNIGNILQYRLIKDGFSLYGEYGVYGNTLRRVDAGNNEIATIKKLTRRGYVEFNELNPSIEKLYALLQNPLRDKDERLLPMKAKPFRSDKFISHSLGQRKINGVRATLEFYLNPKDGLFAEARATFKSMNGREYILPHITDKLTAKHFINYFGRKIVFDGELYIHGRSLEYIRSCIPYRLSNGNISNSTHSSKDIVFKVFDLSIEDTPQYERLIMLSEMNRLTHLYKFNIQVVSYVQLETVEDVYRYKDLYIKEGYEGIIIRNRTAKYGFGKRNYNMMKLKNVYETECEILDILYEGNKNGVEVVKFRLLNDINKNIFLCTAGDKDESWDNETKLFHFNNRKLYIGKLATIKYRERTGITKLPFHANVKTIRDYE